MSGPIPGKASWPELVGMLATPAATRIAQERPDVAVEVLPLGSPVDPEYDPERVRVFLNNYGIVYLVPMIG